MKDVDFQKLNEDFCQLVEKTVDPDFRKAVKDSSDYQRAKLKDAVQRRRNTANDYRNRQNADEYDLRWAKDNDDEADALEKIANAKNMNADRVYREVARFVDVQNAEMLKIPTEGLTSKDLRKKLKSLGKPGVFVIIHDMKDRDWLYSNVYPQNAKRLFTNMNFFFFEEKEGKLDIWPPYHTNDADSPAIENDVVQPMMKEINDGSLAKRVPFIFVFYGDKVTDVRKAKNRQDKPYWHQDPNERIKITDPSDIKPATNPKDLPSYSDGRYDKSGYFVDVRGLLNRLAKFKNERGSFDKDVTNVVDKFKRMIEKYKQLVAEHDFLSDETPLMEEYGKFIKTHAYKFKWLIDAVEQKDARRIENYLKDCQELIAKYDV